MKYQTRLGTLALALLAVALITTGCAPAPEEASEPEAISVSMSTGLDASAADVWKVVGDFGGIDFLSAIASASVEGEGIGAVRTLTLAGKEGGTITERLDALDNEGMSITYSIIESPLPIDNYTSTMTVSKLEEGTATFTWSSNFTAKGISDEEAKKFIEEFYHGGILDLQKLFFGE